MNTTSEPSTATYKIAITITNIALVLQCIFSGVMEFKIFTAILYVTLGLSLWQRIFKSKETEELSIKLYRIGAEPSVFWEFIVYFSCIQLCIYGRDFVLAAMFAILYYYDIRNRRTALTTSQAAKA